MFPLFERPGPLEPPSIYEEMREKAPVARVPVPRFDNAWLVTSYDAVATVLSDRRFVGAPPAAGAEGAADGHARVRRLVTRGLTARRVEAVRPYVEEIGRSYVARMTAQKVDATQPIDLVEAFSAPLAINVLGESLGVPMEERAALRGWVEEALLIGSVPNGERMRQGVATLKAYVTELVAAKRKSPGDDVLTDLIAVRDTDDGRLSDEELTTLIMALLEGGYLSPRNAISVAVMQGIVEGRTSETDPDVDEVLRLLAGLTGEALPRWVQRDLTLEGEQLVAGDMVLARLEAANRDPKKFPDPHRYVPGRGVAHLTFGRGPHHCLGAALARMELVTALNVLAREVPNLRLETTVQDVPWSHGFADSGPATLYVSW
ncbi:cytochrome P450 [Kribbella sp. WER1]